MKLKDGLIPTSNLEAVSCYFSVAMFVLHVSQLNLVLACWTTTVVSICCRPMSCSNVGIFNIQAESSETQ